MLQVDGKLTGSEEVHVGDRNASILDFWRWAFSDLKSNNIRGIFAEWLVAQLLGIDAPVRDSWGECDLITKDGVRIEVKTSAYLQTWAQLRPSTIRFGGLRGCKQITQTRYAAVQTYNADLYVFCVQTERDHDKWTALDVNQWRFYVLTRDEVERRGCKGLSLSVIARMTDELCAEDFRANCLKKIGEAAADRQCNGEDQ